MALTAKGDGPSGLYLSPGTKEVTYYHLENSEPSVFLQCRQPMWVDPKSIIDVSNLKKDHGKAKLISSVEERFHELSVNCVPNEDLLAINSRVLEDERNQLLLNAKETDQLYVDLQNH